MSSLKRSIATCRMSDMKNSPPEGHAPLVRTAGKKPRFSRGQVWVEIGNDRVWRIREITHFGKGGRKLRFVLVPYSGDAASIELTELRLSQTMRVWEAAIRIKEKFIAQMRQDFDAGVWADQFSSFEEFARHFGIDTKTGFRID